MKRTILKRSIFWCPACNVPLLGKTCGCGTEGIQIELRKPYDVRPALGHDRELIRDLLTERFGTDPLPHIILLNKSGGADRNEAVIACGKVIGWLSFEPCTRRHRLDLTPEAVPLIAPHAKSGVVDITGEVEELLKKGRHVTGKKVIAVTSSPEGTVIIRAGRRFGTGALAGKEIRIKSLSIPETVSYTDPSWDDTIRCNRVHLKNIERNAVRTIRRYMREGGRINVSFSGGKDSTATLALAQKAGVEEVYFVDTGMEFPETYEYVESTGIQIRLSGGDFWNDLNKEGIPQKDKRWCCDRLKLTPVREWLAGESCITIQGNRWYESFSRSTLPEITENPFTPGQMNLSPIRNWRALEVFLYIWWRDIPLNPLYGLGFERVGCWMCPAMLESEWEIVKKLHPELYERWRKRLVKWARKKGFGREYIDCGFWRWEVPPPKAYELARKNGIRLPASKNRAVSGFKKK